MTKKRSLKAMRQLFKEEGVFHTPEKIAKHMRAQFPDNVDMIYDPTCGYGNLLSYFEDAEKYGQDIDYESIEVCKERLSNFHGYVGDLLVDPHFQDLKFQYIIANPPFSIKWSSSIVSDDERFKSAPCVPSDSRADMAFILHILHYLRDDGMAVALLFPGVLYRKQREGQIRQWLVEQNYIDRIENISGEEFEDTNVNTVLVTFKKNRTKDTILIVNDGLERDVPIEEIKGNGYTLSPQRYVVKEIPKEEVDPIALERNVRGSMIRKLEAQLNLSIMIYHHFNGLEVNSLLDEIEQLVQKKRFELLAIDWSKKQ